MEPRFKFDESTRERIAAVLEAINATRRCKHDKVPSQIEECLFLGSVGAAGNMDELKRLNVTHILTVATSLVPPHPDDFVYKVIPVKDTDDTDLTQYFDECFAFIDEAKRLGGGVLVHCFVGRSRSATIVVAYLMKNRGMSMSQALEYVKSRRPLASPNSGFMLQLQDYQKSLEANQEVKSG